MSVPGRARSRCPATESVVTTPSAVSANCTASMGPHDLDHRDGPVQPRHPLLAMFTGGQTIDLSSTATSVPRELPPSPPPVPSATLASPSPSRPRRAALRQSPSASPSGRPSDSPSPVEQRRAQRQSVGRPCPAPIADFYWSPASPSKKTNVTFLDTVDQHERPSCSLHWTWSFGDGSGGSTLQNPVYSLPVPRDVHGHAPRDELARVGPAGQSVPVTN
jgi:hypothetical protein